jgi:hypothetical protein
MVILSGFGLTVVGERPLDAESERSGAASGTRRGSNGDRERGQANGAHGIGLLRRETLGSDRAVRE